MQFLNYSEGWSEVGIKMCQDVGFRASGTHLVAGLQVRLARRYQRVVHIEDERRQILETICIANFSELGTSH